MANNTSSLITKLLSLHKEILLSGISVTLSQESFKNGSRTLSMQLNIDAEFQQKIKRRKSASRRKKEMMRLVVWKEKKRVEAAALATLVSKPPPPSNPSHHPQLFSSLKSTTTRKRKVSEAQLSPPSRGIPQVEGEADCSADIILLSEIEANPSSLEVFLQEDSEAGKVLPCPPTRNIPQVDGEADLSGDSSYLSESVLNPPSPSPPPQDDNILPSTSTFIGDTSSLLTSEERLKTSEQFQHAVQHLTDYLSNNKFSLH